MRTLSDEIINIVRSEANNNPAPLSCTVSKNYDDSSYVDVILDDEKSIFKYVPVIGDNTVGIEGILCFLDGNEDNTIVITNNNKINEENTILALGLGLFKIKNKHLFVELPLNTPNPFRIENNHLIVTLPEGSSNDYEIIENNLIYHRGG